MRVPEPIRDACGPCAARCGARAEDSLAPPGAAAAGGRTRERILVRMLRAHYRACSGGSGRVPTRCRTSSTTGSAARAVRGRQHAVRLVPGLLTRRRSCRDGDVLLTSAAATASSRPLLRAALLAVDAIDIEPSAIGHALAQNTHPTGRVVGPRRGRPAVPAERTTPWCGTGRSATSRPRRPPDAREDPRGLGAGGRLRGIRDTRATRAHDHLQFFASLDDLGDLLGQHFAHVQVRAQRFPLKEGVERTRRTGGVRSIRAARASGLA